MLLPIKQSYTKVNYMFSEGRIRAVCTVRLDLRPEQLVPIAAVGLLRIAQLRDGNRQNRIPNHAFLRKVGGEVQQFLLEGAFKLPAVRHPHARKGIHTYPEVLEV